MNKAEVPPVRETDDLAALAKGGRQNVLGFLLRLGARIPFLLIASRLYGASTLGRFALAVLVIEFFAQLATLGLKRGLAEQLASARRPQSHVVADAMLLTLILAMAATVLLAIFPAIMFPNSRVNGLDQLFPLIIIAVALSDVALAACAFNYDVAATVRARGLIEPWVISFAAGGLYFYSARDGLILSYVISMLCALAASIHPLIRHFGLPRQWRPTLAPLWQMTRLNLPLAAADAIEWGTRRIDLWLLGFFLSPVAAGVYYVAQQFATLPQKMKTSFEPVLGPVITRRIAENDYRAIAQQVGQVGFWIIAAQVGIAIALCIPARAEMGVMGPQFVSGTGAFIFLQIAEALAAPAVVSEAALIYLARGRNLWLSILTIALQAILTVLLIIVARHLELPEMWMAAAAAMALAVSLAIGSELKTRSLCRITGHPIRMWRPSLAAAAALSGGVGALVLLLPRSMEWAQMSFGIPAMLLIYGAVIWRFGFGPSDRALFRTRPA